MAAVAPFEPRSGLSAGERLGNRIAELNAYLTVAEAHFLELLHEFDERRYWEDLGFRNCAEWLNFKCGLGLNAARERLRVAHALQAVPKIQAAFAEGRVSFSKVRAMTRIATPDNEDLLLNIAHHGTAYHVERFVSHYRQIEKLGKPGAAELPSLHDRRELEYYRDDDGCLVIKARLPAEQGELVLRALEYAMENASDSAVTDVTAETPDQSEPLSVRRADALYNVAETYLNHPDNVGSTADRYQVVVHVRADSEASSAHLENGPHVTAETSERIACDCCVTTIEENARGEPLDIGRRSRSIPPPMRRALVSRDGGCRFPGCTSHRYCDGHHIKHWQHGGETKLDNLVLLCRHHHRLVHEGGFDCARSETGEVYFVDRRSRRLAEYEPPTAASIVASLGWMVRRSAGYGIDGGTSAAKWNGGETIDWDHAMLVAFQGERSPQLVSRPIAASAKASPSAT